MTCAEYASLLLCRGGGYGPRWEESFGLFADWAAVNNTGAGEACCTCGGGIKRAGCLSPLATNWDSTSLVHDGSCAYPREGCADSVAANFLADYLCC